LAFELSFVADILAFFGYFLQKLGDILFTFLDALAADLLTLVSQGD
jgi:hypothetical protein